MRSNSKNLNIFTKELDEEFNSVVEKTVMEYEKDIARDAFREVLKRSPVSSGSFLVSNRIGIETADESFMTYPSLEGPKEQRKVQEQTRKAVATNVALLQLEKLNRLRPWRKVIISNSCPHAQAVEFGISDQAPQGVYGISAENMELVYSTRKYTKTEYIAKKALRKK